MRNRKKFAFGFAYCAVVVGLLNLVPHPMILTLSNAVKEIGFPFRFAYIGEFGGRYQFEALAGVADAFVGLALAFLGGYFYTKVAWGNRG